MDNAVSDKARILIVSADAEQRKGLREALAGHGYAPVTAASGSTAYKRLKAQPLALALIDLQTTEASLDLSEQIKQRSPSTDCIVILGDDALEMASNATVQDICTYLQKPYEMNSLLTTIQTTLEKSEEGETHDSSEKRYRALFEQANDAIFLENERQEIIDVNPRACEMFGYTREELMRMRTVDLQPKERHDLPMQTAERFETTAQHRDGRVFPVEITLAEVKENTQQLYMTIVRDITDRVEAERALRQEKDRTQKYLDVAEIILLAIDPQGKVSMINQKGCAVLGYEEEELIGKDWFDTFLPARVREKTRAEFRKALDGDLTDFVHKENPVLTKSGEERLISWHNTQLTDEDGNIRALLSSGDDITEQRAAHEALRLGEERYRSVVENSQEAILIVDNNYRINYANRELGQLLGYPTEEIVGRDFREFVDEQSVDLVADRYKRRQREEPVPSRYKFHIVRQSGERRLVEISSSVIKDSTGNAFTVGQMLDITEREQAIQALRESEERYRSLVEVSPDAIVVVSEEKLAYVNSAAVKLTGASSTEELLAEDIFRFVVPSSREAVAEWARQAIEEGGPLPPIEERLLRLDGRILDVEITGSRLDYQSSTAIQLVVRDITERKLRERELEVIVMVSSALRKASSHVEMPPTVLDQLSSLLQTQGAALVLHHPNTGENEIVLARGAWSEVTGTHLSPEEGISAIVVQTGEVYLNNDLQQSADPRLTHMDIMTRVKAIACTPLLIQDEVIGALWVGRDQPFSEQDVHLLKAISNISASAIHRARLHDQTEQLFAESKHYAAELEQRLEELQEAKEAIDKRNIELARLYRAYSTLLSSTTPNMQRLGKNIVDTVMEEFGQSNCRLFLLETGENDLSLIASSHSSGRKDSSETLSIDGDGIVPKATRSGELISIPDVTEQSTYTPTSKDARSELAIPLKIGERVIGALEVMSPEPDAFDSEDKRLLTIYAERAAMAIENARLFQEAHHRLDILQGQRDLGMAINASLDLHLTLNILLNQVAAQLDADVADVLLLDQASTLNFAAGRGFRTKAIEQSSIRMGESYAGQAAFERRIIAIPDFEEETEKGDADFTRMMAGENLCSYFAAPLIAKGEVKGVLEIYRRTPFHPNSEWISYLETLAGQAASAIHNAELVDNLQLAKIELEVAYGATLEGWVRALDLRDQETEGHTHRVTDMTLRLATAMQVPEDDIVHMRWGALLHDIGKMAIPDGILRKPGPLSEDEWAIMRKHPEYAYELLAPIAYLRPALDIPYCHHERWDGTGYPRGLKGEEIPLAARIFAVVDVWDALSSDRPYRTSWTNKKVRQYLSSESGKHFDPHVVDIFLEEVLPNHQAE